MNNHSKSTIILATGVVILSTALLLAMRFEPHGNVPIFIDGDEVRRGESIEADERLVFDVGDATIFMHEGAIVKLIDLRPGSEVINVITGHITVRGEVTIQTREVKTLTHGTVSFEHISSRDVIAVRAMRGRAEIVTKDDDFEFMNARYDMTTLAPYQRERSEIALNNEAHAEFLQWVLEHE